MADTPALNSSQGLPSQAKVNGPAQGRYAALMSTRDSFLVRARRQAGLTIPYLFRESGANDSTSETTAWQSHGARCVNNLAAKLILAMFPPGRPFIRLKPGRVTKLALNQLDPDSRGALQAELDKGLSAVELEFVDCVEMDGDRATLFDAARHLIAGGNYAIKVHPDGALEGVALDNYVTRRSPKGTLLEWVILTSMGFDEVPPDVQAIAVQSGYDPSQLTNPAQKIDVYTHGILVAGQMQVYQEAYGQRVPGSEGYWDPEMCPYLFLCMVLLKNEHYGRSYCEDYEGDLQSCDSLTEIVTTGSAAAARFIQGVRPGGMVTKKQLAEANNGDVLTGNAEDVWTVQANKSADFSTAETRLAKVEDRLSAAFLLNSAVQRDAERVTAEEIRYVAQELEDGLGGVYANQVVTWQRPYAVVKLRACQRNGRITSFNAKAVDVTIIAGMAAIGRNDELAALDNFMQGGIASVGAPVMTQSINPRIYLSKRAAALGINTDGLVYSEEEATQQMQAQQQQHVMELFGPELVKQIGQYVTRSNAAAITANPQTAPAPVPTAPQSGGVPPSGGLVPFAPSQAPQNTPQAQPSSPINP